MAISLSNRALQLTTPAGSDALVPLRVDVSERVSQPFQWTLDLVSEQSEINSEDLLGKDVTLTFRPPSGKRARFFNGFVTEFLQAGYIRRLHQYRAVVRPWLWFLTRAADCRIFQNKSVPDIFEAIVKQYGFTDYRLKLSTKHAPRGYCVQYRETDFNFVSRLLEQEGIHYFFEHADGHHTMVLCDDSTTLGTVPGYEQVPYFAPDGASMQAPRDHFSGWTVARSVQSGAYATTDFDFEMPRKTLLGRAELRQKHARSNYEIFDFPAELAVMDSGEAKRIAQLRVEELHGAYLLAHGHGDAAGVASGHRFKLIEYPRKDVNIEYLVISASYLFHGVAADAGSSDGEFEFSVNVEAIDARTAFRPPRVTPKPVIHGAQTALVVGTSGAEIDTDKYGRVKVQFPWDRYGKSDENSSCWVRVAQVWAGKNWGAIHTPRIGQEVLVSFLEGDPDRPIVTGRVYNGDAMPPYDLPAKATQSGIKSRSSKGGSAENFNEIRFEDKKGEEELYVHAEKDLKKMVEHDQTVEVGHDETVGIGGDRSSSIGGNETEKIGKDLSTSIGQNEKRSVGKSRTTDVGESEKRTVSKDESITVGKRYVLKAGDEITLQTGASKLVMKKDGTIELQGKSITINGSQSITEKAGQKIEISAMQIKVSGTMVEVKGTKTAVQGTMLDLKASAVASLKGGVTKIG